MQAVYTALKETEQRATDVLPLWKLSFLHPLIPRQRKATEAVQLIRATTEQLIAKCREMVDAEEQVRHMPYLAELMYRSGTSKYMDNHAQDEMPCRVGDALAGSAVLLMPTARPRMQTGRRAAPLSFLMHDRSVLKATDLSADCLTA